MTKTQPEVSHALATRLPAWLWAPCALYAISAACILLGITKIIVPVYDDALHAERRMLEKFSCLIAMNLYELALLGVTFLILFWRSVFDDAIALTLLICIFLVGSAITLDTVAPDFPVASMLFGAAGLLAAWAKLFALNRFVVGKMTWLMLAGVAGLLAWNCLMPGVLGLILKQQIADKTLTGPLRAQAMQDVWLVGWYVTLAAGSAFVVSAICVSTGDANIDAPGQPFLRSAAMRWITVGVIVAGSCAHQWALIWAFGLSLGASELLPAVCILSLIGLEVIRGHGYAFGMIDGLLCVTPLCLGVMVVGAGDYQMHLNSGFGAVSNPGVCFAMFAAVLFVSSMIHRRACLQAMAGGYAMASLTVIHADPVLDGQQGWLFVFASFVILGAGAWASIHKAGIRDSDDEDSGGADHVSSSGLSQQRDVQDQDVMIDDGSGLPGLLDSDTSGSGGAFRTVTE